jgi:hypothetical protein
MNFTYSFVDTPDGTWGASLPDGSWSGFIGQLMKREADVRY